MAMVMVEEGHIVHAVSMYNEEFWLAWGDLPLLYEDPWTIGDTPPRSDSQTATETVTKGAADGTDQLAQTTLEQLMIGTMAVVEQGATTYVEGVDYNILAGGIVDWSLAGAEPVTSTTYTVQYRYVTDEFNTLDNEVGRRSANQVAYVVEDQFGDIVANGSTWSIVTAAQAEVTDITCLTNVQAAGIVDLDSRILITAEDGYINNLIINIEDNGVETGDNASVSVTSGVMTVEIDDGVTTEGTIATAISGDAQIDTAVADTPALVWTLGVGTDTGTITGGTGYAGGESFKFYDTNGVGYYVWITSDAAGADPSHVDHTGVQVDILTTDTADNVATKIAAQLDLLAAFAAPAPAAEIITMTAAAMAEQQDAEDVDMLVTIDVPTQGTDYPTRNLYIEFKFQADEASDKDIYQIALYLNTTRTVITPSYQEYLIPSEILDPGQMYMTENIEPFPRSPGKREIFEFVIVF